MEKHVNIISLGSYLPKQKVYSSDVMEQEGLTPDKIERAGIESVYIADETEQPTFMGIQAAKQAIENAGTNGEDIDLVIFVTAFITDYTFWADHAYVMHELGIRNANSLKIDQGCNGAIAGMELAKALLLNNTYKKILIVAADRFNKDFINRWSASPFCFYGDGGSAAILTIENHSCFEVINTYTYTNGYYSRMNYIECGGNVFPPTSIAVEEGKCTYSSKKVANEFWKDREEERKGFYTDFMKTQKRVLFECLDRTGLTINDLDYMVFYNVSAEHYKRLFNQIDFDPEKTSAYLARNYGHMGSADIFFNLKEEFNAGRIKHGDVVAVLCAGTGFSWGCCILKI